MEFYVTKGEVVITVEWVRYDKISAKRSQLMTRVLVRLFNQLSVKEGSTHQAEPQLGQVCSLVKKTHVM